MATSRDRRALEPAAAALATFPWTGPARLAEARDMLELHRSSTRFLAQASQILLQSVQDLARRQTEAMRETVEELGRLPSGLDGTVGPELLLELQHRYVRASVLGFLAQVQVGLDAVASSSAAAFALVEDQLATVPEAPRAVPPNGHAGS